MQEFFGQITQNGILMVSLCAWALAQILKALISYIFLRRFSVERLFGAGGMPSSHAALVVSLTTAVGLVEGTASPLFAFTFVVAMVVMYDATGVRQAAGKHARALNQILQQMRRTHTVPEFAFKEFLGHTPVEVIAGAALGFGVAYAFIQW